MTNEDLYEDLYESLIRDRIQQKLAREFTEEEWKKYKQKHPKADPKKHEIRKTKGKGKGEKGKTKKPESGAGEDREKLLTDRAKQVRDKLPPDLKDHDPTTVDKLPKEFHEEIKEYKLDIVGDDAAKAVDIARKIRKGIKDSADVCKLSPPICVDNMGLTRDKMPQITDESVKSMLGSMPEKEYDDLAKKVKKGGLSAIKDPKKRKSYLNRAKGLAAVAAGANPDSDTPVFKDFLGSLEKRGIKSKVEDIPVGKLKATQSEIQAAKVYGMADAHLSGKYDSIGDSVVVSRDGHLLDGHHRWAAVMTIDPKRKMNVKVIDMDMKDLLKEAAKHPGVFQADISGLPLDEDAQKKYKSQSGSSKGKGKKAMLRKEVIRLAHQNPELRPYLLPLLEEPVTKTSSAKGSIESHIEKGLGEVAEAVGLFLKSKFPQAFRVKTNPSRAGYLKMVVSGEVLAGNGQFGGDFMVFAQFEGKHPTVEVLVHYVGLPGQYRKPQQYSRELVFSISAPSQEVARHVGPAFQRDLENWIAGIAKTEGM